MPYAIQSSLTLEDSCGVNWGKLSGASEAAYITTPAGQTAVGAISDGAILSHADIQKIQSEKLNFVRRGVKSPNSIPDCIGVLPYVVSEKVRSIIQDCQPVDPIFLPVEATLNGLENITGYYVMHVSHRLDCIDYQRTNYGKGGPSDLESKRRDIPLGHKYTLLPDFNSGKSHIWLPAKPQTSLYFISDSLCEHLKTENIRGWAYVKCLQ